MIDRDCMPRMRDQFREQHLVRLPSFIEGNILNRMLHHLEAVQLSKDLYFSNKTGLRVGNEMAVDPTSPAPNMLTMLLNNSELFKVVEEITGITPIRNFMGRIYLCQPNADHQIYWHDDNHNNRLVGISVNLSKEPFVGAVLQLRDKASQKILAENANTGLGDAVIFRISSKIEHRTTLLEGTATRTAGAGWFHSYPDFQSLLRFCKEGKFGDQ
ncbi:MAG TPA: hypothetical protein VFC63_27565 [Blastocatellia bacterium]|nr:hypothetical protein [Blastocatellia bacterium]